MGVELAAFAALGIASAYLGISDLKSRVVDIRAVFACYVLSACVNGVVLASCPACNGADFIRAAAGSIIVILFLSGAMVAFHRIGLVASGDALAVPALLSMLTFVASPVWILSYFVSAMAFVLAAFTVKNVVNNLNHVGSAFGPLWRRLYLLVFCYYGSRDSCRYAFRSRAGSIATMTASLIMQKQKRSGLSRAIRCSAALLRLLWSCLRRHF